MACSECSETRSASILDLNTTHPLCKGSKKKALYSIKESDVLSHPDAAPQWLNRDKLKLKVCKHYKFVNSKSLVEFCSGRLGDADAYYLLKN